jgi:LEM3 (ligand-effect modulator 3) family / CDC50 family
MQLSEQEDLIVWMRPAALPKFRKLYGVIEVDLDANNVVSIHIANNYNTYSFGGAKKVIMTTSKWLGAGRNSFLGFAYLVTGTLSLLLSILFALIHVRNPRYFSIL